MPLVLSSRHLGKVYVIECKGRIVMGDEADALDAELRFATREFTRVVLNVAEVSRTDSTGLGLIVKHATNLHKVGGDIRLASPPKFLVALLNVTNLSRFLRVCETEDAAVLSFADRQPAQKIEKHRARVLFFDPSPDLCAFVRAVLTQHGFDLKWTTSFGEAKTRLRLEDVDCILVGPGTPQLSSQTALRGLRAAAPKADALHLPPDFNTREAHEAAELLLGLFQPTQEQQRNG